MKKPKGLSREMKSLIEALKRAREAPPPNLTEAVKALPAVGSLPSPWEVWVLIGLIRFWLWLVQKARGKKGGVGRSGDGAEGIGPFDYSDHLNSLKAPEPPERRVLDLHPSVYTVRESAAGLRAAGALVSTKKRVWRGSLVQISPEVLCHEADFTAFCEAWADRSRRAWLAALVGDWPAVHDEARKAGDQELAALAAGRAEECRQARRPVIEHAGGTWPLTDLCGESGLGEALKGPPGERLTWHAFRFIIDRDDPAWCPDVLDFCRRVAPDGASPDRDHWLRSLHFLLSHGCGGEVLSSLPLAGERALGEAFLLALEHTPGQALALARRALRSRDSGDRHTVAAALALIDKPWSRQELLAVLEESNDQKQTEECRVALLKSAEKEAHKAVRAWEKRNPEPTGTPRSLKMAAHRSMKYELKHLEDRVRPLRGRVLPEPPTA